MAHPFVDESQPLTWGVCARCLGGVYGEFGHQPAVIIKVANYPSITAHVRFGSLAAATALIRGVRFTPESGHEDGRSPRPLGMSAMGQKETSKLDGPNERFPPSQC
jgi:hypothetical protein